MYLDEISQLRRNDEDVWNEGNLSEALELLIIHVDLLRRRVQRVITE